MTDLEQAQQQDKQRSDMPQALKTEVVVQEQGAAVTPMALVQLAVQQGANVDQLQKLFELQLRWEADQARKAYNEAFASFKAEAVSVIKRVAVTDGPLKGKKYADLAGAVDAATPMLSKHRLSASWKITKDEKDWIEVTCTLSHVAGHSESTSFGGPPDTGGAKNPMQARASTLNYVERYTFLAVTGLAAKGADDDGRGGDRVMPESVKADFLAAVEALADMPAWEALWRTITAATTAAGDVGAHEALRAAMAKKRRELSK